MDKKYVEYLWTELLREIGEDPQRAGLLKTPHRVARMYEEIFQGYLCPPPHITMFLEEGVNGLVIDRGYFFSNCEHHCIPFFGNYYYGYIPKDSYLIGASKIARTVDHFSARLQIAERLCRDIIGYLEEKATPLGSILIMTGRHLCKEMRGVKKHDSSFEAIEARGILLKNEGGCKDEFLSRIGGRIQ